MKNLTKTVAIAVVSIAAFAACSSPAKTVVKKVNVPGPTRIVTKTVPGPTRIVTNTVPGPTVVKTVPGPTVVKTVSPPGCRAALTAFYAAVNNFVNLIRSAIPGSLDPATWNASTATIEAMGPATSAACK